MICRSSLNNISKTILYSMSKKKLTQEYRKPIQQLKKQRQPKPMSQSQFQKQKKKAKWGQKQEPFSKNIQSESQPKQNNNERVFDKKKLATNAVQRQQRFRQSTTSQKPIEKLELSNKNWLEQSQSNIGQYVQYIKDGLKFLENRKLKQLKDLITQVKSKFGIQGFQTVTGALFKTNFMAFYSLMKDLGFQIKSLPLRTVTIVILGLARQSELTELNQVVKYLCENDVHLEFKHDQFFQLLFSNELSNDLKYLFGESGTKISSNNKDFTQKLQIATVYLKALQQNVSKKIRSKKAQFLPIWLDYVIRTVKKYKFAKDQFKILMNQIFFNNEYLIPEWYYETEYFCALLRDTYFGDQSSLVTVLGLYQKYSKVIRFPAFYKNLTTQLVNYQICQGQAAFYVDETLIQFYQKGFTTINKHLSIVCCFIGSQSSYLQLSEHYLKNYMYGFPNQTLSSQTNKYIQQSILNSYNRVQNAQQYQSLIEKISKNGQNTLIKLKAAIKLGDKQMAYGIFQQDVFRNVAVERQRRNIQFVLRRKLGNKSVNFNKVNDINQFLDSLTQSYLWNLYRNSQDASLMLKQYLPQDKFSFWEQTVQKDRFEQISKKLNNGKLQKQKQPAQDIAVDEFSVQQYINNQLPPLAAQQALEYQVEKQFIKWMTKIQSLIELQKIQANVIILKKLSEYQQELPQRHYEMIQKWGLKDFVINQEQKWDDFVRRFNNMRIYKKVQKSQKLQFQDYRRFLSKQQSLLRKSIIEQMILKTPEVFREAQKFVKLKEQNIVQKLLTWGVYTRQPMAIYLAQKLAMQTGQSIPHSIALPVSKLLSHRRIMSQSFISECKSCLSIVGRIQREFIYDFDKEYEHILTRKYFNQFVLNTHKDKSQEFDLIDLVSTYPNQQILQKEPKFYIQSIQCKASQVL